jgi:transposase
MKKPILVGIDVASRNFVVATARCEWVFDNDPAGHRQLVRKLTRGGRQARVVLEATGIYHLDLALALDEAQAIEVMVANPRAVRDFGRARFQRSKTDRTDAKVLLAFAEHMPFVTWQPPAPEILALRAVARRITALTATAAQERNRLHAARHDVIREDIETHLSELEQRMERLQSEALALLDGSPRLRRRFDHLCSVKGIATTSAIRILAELAVLPDDMTVRQWVAHAGLDPRHVESGTSIAKPPRISKVGNRHIRAALYMPALVAIQYEPHVAAFYEALLARGKKPLQAIVAVMRKLLHAIYGMFQNDADFDGPKFYELRP